MHNLELQVVPDEDPTTEDPTSDDPTMDDKQSEMNRGKHHYRGHSLMTSWIFWYF